MSVDENGAGGDNVKTVRVHYSGRDERPEYCTGVSVNYTGQEFIVTLLQAVPPMWARGEEIPEEIEGKILARVVLTPERWLDVVDTITNQIARLRAEGAPMPPAKQRSEVDADN